MFRVASFDPKHKKLNKTLIKMKYIINRALTEIKYEENHPKKLAWKKSYTSSEAESIE